MTAKTKTDRWRRMLSHGYFAPELPPCFVSDDIARFRKSIFDGIASLPQINQRPNFHRYITEPSWFYFPRFGREDRRHGVPNPIAYLLLAKTIADNYVQLRRAARRSDLSASPPIFDWSGPRALVRPNVDLRDDFRMNLSSRREEYVAADIRAFFHSIYTHSIPWAIHGKAWSKTNRGIQHVGNLLDLLCRNLQDGQTIGLPVGPDASRLLAELVASAMDEQLRQKLNTSGRDSSRYIDDYTISTADGQTGETMIAALRQVAAHFELELNSGKSTLVSTSTRHTTGWKQAVRTVVPRGNPDTASMQLFFYEVGRLCTEHTDINVEKFAFANARSSFVRTDGWSSVQGMLINAYRRNSTLVSFLVEVFILRQVQHSDVDLADLKEFLDHRIPVLAQANRSGEIIWFLFLAMRLDIVISNKAASSLVQIDNAMVALLLAVANSRRQVSGHVDLSGWNASLTPDGLRGQMWLYAYEAARLGLAPGFTTAFIEQDPYFSLLLARGVSFFNLNNGFTSINATLRSRREDNVRTSRLRADFLDDFDFDTEDYDDDDFEDFDFEDSLDY